MNDYEEYLGSSSWKILKKTKLNKQPICECCDLRHATTVHHLSYERLGNESSRDVVSICRKCHEKCHFDGKEKIPLHERNLRARFEEVREEYLTTKQQTIELHNQLCLSIGADPDTFKVIGSDTITEYAKDNKHIFRKAINGGKWKVIQEADFESFDDIGGRFQDRNFIYFGNSESKKRAPVYSKIFSSIVLIFIGLGFFAASAIFPPIILVALFTPYYLYEIWTDQF